MRIGSHIGVFEVAEPLGAGGMGEVYRARDTRLGRDVALKVLPGEWAADAQRRARFDREARVLAALNHPNIATLYGVEDAPTGPVLVMELVEGTTLADRLALGDRFPLAEALAIARQVAAALEAAHEQGIIHRDLKPANIALRPDGTVKVLDFGLAKALAPSADGPDSQSTVTLTDPHGGLGPGTPAYLSPEQARGQPADTRADIWAFGCVLYEMLTGRRAFAGDSVSEVIAKIIEREPDLDALPPATPRRAADAGAALPREGREGSPAAHWRCGPRVARPAPGPAIRTGRAHLHAPVDADRRRARTGAGPRARRLVARRARRGARATTGGSPVDPRAADALRGPVRRASPRRVGRRCPGGVRGSAPPVDPHHGPARRSVAGGGRGRPVLLS